MLWFLLITGLIGAAFYVVDKKIKEKYKADDKFNPDDWDLLGSIELPVDAQPHVATSIAHEKIATEKIGYEKRPHSLTANQANFFKALQQAVSGDYTLLTNINVADVLSVVAHNNVLVAKVAEKNIAARTFDFLLCENENLRAVCVLVLGDMPEPLLLNACESASLPVARFKLQANYDPTFIRSHIFQALGISETINPGIHIVASKSALDIKTIETPLDEAPEKENGKKDIVDAENNDVSAEKNTIRIDNGIDLKLCPKCSAVMLKRKAKTGANAGHLFWICSTYPSCRGMLAVK